MIGYVKNVDEVAGFESHQIRFGADWSGNLRGISKANLKQRFPEANGLEINWRVNRFQLVSLLLHETPQVYKTDELPSMEELLSEEAETRTLSAFESDGLEKLNVGKDLHTHATTNRIVMLGAIRASQECLSCHSVDSGDLLGAFSYEFLREPRVVDSAR